jgi:hypothetical protein
MIAKITKFAFAIIALFAVCDLWQHWQTIHFCDQAKPGLPYAKLAAMFLQSGNETWWSRQFPKQGTPGVWKVYLPDPATVGEYACTIEHDGTKVLSSRYGR